MSSVSNRNAEYNLIFAGLGLQLGIISKDKVIRAFTEWLFDKSVPLGQILLQQKAINQEQKNTLESAVKAHIQQEGDQEKALASLHMVKDLESDLDHLADKDLMGTLDAAVSKRKSLGLDLLFSQSHGVDSKDGGFTFEGPSSNVKDRFERQQFLDSGNLGEVYFAKDTELNRLVVAKYIRPDRANEGLTKALFHLEGEVTGSLEHPNIVPVYGLGKDTKGRLYYAMRYIRGRKFTRVIAEYNQIPKSESSKKHEALIGLLQYFQSACLAIEYAHSKGVLHCDIKPDNIMIGDYGEVFVVDWGLVVVQGEVKGSSDIHQMETMDPGVIPPYRPSEDASSGLHEQQGGSRKGVGGTPAYMAPEQFKATLEEDISLVSAKADIYALGATLYHLITGRAPHLPKGEGKESPDAFYFRITTGMIPKPKEIKPEVSNSLQGIVLKAMEVSPEDRYTSARELAEDIKRWVADEPVIAYRENISERGSRFARNNKALLTAAALMMVFVTAAGLGFGFVTQNYEKQAVKDKEKAKRNEQEAITQRDKAEENERIARDQKYLANRQLYFNLIKRAENELLQNNLESLKNILATIPFANREWEHTYLSSFSNKYSITLDGFTRSVTFVSLNPDGKKIASCNGDEIIIQEALTGNKILSINGPNSFSSVSFNPEGNTILSTDRNSIKIWDATSGKMIKKIIGHDGSITCASWSPDGKRILSGGLNPPLIIWDTSTGKKLRSFEGHTEKVNGISWSPDGKRILSCSIEGTHRIWEVESGKEVLTLLGHNKGNSCVSFSPDGKLIASGGEDNDVIISDILTGKTKFILKGHKGPVTGISFCPDGTKIGSCSEDKTIKVWDSSSSKEIVTFSGHTGKINKLNFFPDGKSVVSGSEDKTIKIWNVNNASQFYQTKENSNRILKLSPNEKTLLFVDHERKNEIIGVNIQSMKKDFIIKEHKRRFKDICYSSNGDFIASGDDHGVIKIWSDTGKELKRINAHSKDIICVSFSPDGKKLVSSSSDQTIKVWDINSGSLISAYTEKFSGYFYGLLFCPNGKQIIHHESNGLIIWDIENGRIKKTLSNMKADFSDFKFSPEGNLFAGFDNGEIWVWDPNLDKIIMTIKGNCGIIGTLDFLDGRKLLSESFEGKDNFKTVQIWDVKTGLETLRFKQNLSETILANGRKLIGWDRDQKVTVQELLPNLENRIVNYLNNSIEIDIPAIDKAGQTIAHETSDNAIQIIEAESGREINYFKGIGINLTNLAFSKDGDRLFGKGFLFDQKIWNTRNGKQLNPIKSFTKIHGFIGNEKVVGDYPDQTIGIVDLKNQQETLTIKVQGGTKGQLKISADGEKILYQMADNKATVWDTKTGKEILTINEKLYTSDFNSSSSHVIGLASNNKLISWNLLNGKQTLNSEITDGDLLTDLGLWPYPFPEGNKILAMTDLKTFKIFDINSGQEIGKFKNDKNVNSYAMSRNGKRLVCVDDSGKITVWHPDTGQKIAESPGYNDADCYLLISPDGKKTIINYYKQSLTVLNTENLSKIWQVEINDENGSYPVLLPDGSRLVGTIDGKSIKIWELEQGKEIISYQGFTNGLNDFAYSFSLNGDYILSNGFDEKIIAWDIKTGKELILRNDDLQEITPVLNDQKHDEQDWTVELEGTYLWLVNTKIRKERIARDKLILAKWTKPDAAWHLKNAKENEEKNEWFAAEFHLKKLLEIEPNNKHYKFQIALLKLSSQQLKPEEYFKKYQEAFVKAFEKPVLFNEKITDKVFLESILIPNGHVKTRISNEIEISKPFYMGKYEVTQEQWEAIMGNNPSGQKGPKLPVTNVSWNDCQEFIKKLNQKTNGKYRLPTGKEWEYACRAGTTTDFAFGDQLLPDQANFKDSKLGKFTDVGSYKPNNFGLYDMHGNAFEWIADITGIHPNTTAKKPEDPKEIIWYGFRGGYFNDPVGTLKSSNLVGGVGSSKYPGSGFRVLKEID